MGELICGAELRHARVLITGLEVADMELIAAASVRLEHAVNLPGILDAACEAFEDMLPVLHELQDPAGGAFAAFVMSAAVAANGRDAVMRAPSLPPTAPRDDATPALGQVTALEAATALARLARLLDARLADAAAAAADPDDSAACADAARQARRLVNLLDATTGQ